MVMVVVCCGRECEGSVYVAMSVSATLRAMGNEINRSTAPAILMFLVLLCFNFLSIVSFVANPSERNLVSHTMRHLSNAQYQFHRPSSALPLKWPIITLGPLASRPERVGALLKESKPGPGLGVRNRWKT